MSGIETPPVKTPLSPKAVAAGIASFLAPTAIILIDYLLGEGKGIFHSLPLYLQILIFSLLTSATTLIATYQKRDPLREVGQKAINRGLDVEPV